MNTQIHHMQDKVLVVIDGELDTPSCEAFKASISPLMEREDYNIEIDMSRVSYISSRGLRVLLSLAQSQTQGSVKAFGVCPAVMEVFQLTGFDKILL